MSLNLFNDFEPKSISSKSQDLPSDPHLRCAPTRLEVGLLVIGSRPWCLSLMNQSKHGTSNLVVAISFFWVDYNGLGQQKIAFLLTIPLSWPVLHPSFDERGRSVVSVRAMTWKVWIQCSKELLSILRQFHRPYFSKKNILAQELLTCNTDQ